MLSNEILEQIARSPRYSAGISFSDRTIRYVEIEQKKGTATLSAHGTITVPYDVVKQGVVQDKITFTEIVKKLQTKLHQQARVVIRTNELASKKSILQIAGFQNVVGKEGFDLLRYIFLPHGVTTERICLFANGDRSYFFKINERETTHLMTLSKQELFTLEGKERIQKTLLNISNKHIICAGVYDDETFVEELTGYRFELVWTNIWQNIFNISAYVPQLSMKDSFQYTIPAGLLIAGIFEDLTGNIVRSEHAGTHKENTFPEEQKIEFSELFETHKPLTKQKEDQKES